MLTKFQKRFITAAVKILRIPEPQKGIFLAKVKVYIITYKKPKNTACRLAFADLLILKAFGVLK